MPISQVACIIPARLNSSRYPAKLLEKAGGLPIIAHTITRVLEAGCFSEIFCFTDSQEIALSLKDLPCMTVRTKAACNGTERIANHLEWVTSSWIVNLQGDEPLFPVWELRRICRYLIQQPSHVHILVYFPDNISEWLKNSNRMKTLVDKNGLVRRFQRQVSLKEIRENKWAWGIQMGVYGYSKDFLDKYRILQRSEEELRIDHELLRKFDLAPIMAHAAKNYSPPLDVRDDLPLICQGLEKA